MRITIAWNVWNNYQDILLGSEILRLANYEKERFASLYLISQGGYPAPPSEQQMRYLDQHLKVTIDEDNALCDYHPKFKGVFRVLNGLRQAYDVALAQGSDFAIVTNADAWCLDLDKLAALLERRDVGQSAVCARIGLVTALDINFGIYVPFFDDHFVVLNVSLCRQHGVFDYEIPKAFNAHFWRFGGIHYMLGALMDERVPPGLFNSYTNLADCVNHFGESSGFSLLPWQYQPSYAFLHANCEQEPELHSLRAAMLRLHGLDRFPAIREYCEQNPVERHIIAARDYVYYRQTWGEKMAVQKHMRPYRLYQWLLRRARYSTHALTRSRVTGMSGNALHYFDAYRDVLPLALASRRRKV
jgi:hypothetical protein